MLSSYARWRRMMLRPALVILLVVVAITGAMLRAQAPAPTEVSLRIIVAGSTAEAEKVLTRLLTGVPFETVARELSIDPSASQGGLIGPVSPASLRPELQAALTGLTPGQISRVVTVPTGFAILRLERVAGGGADGGTVNEALAASGSVKFVAEVSGFPEARAAIKAYAKPQTWNHDPQTICEARRGSIAEMHRALAARLTTLEQAAPSRDLVHALMGQGLLHAYDGRLDDTLAHLEKAYVAAATQMPDLIPFLEEAIGVAHLHKALMENGVQEAPGERYLLSARPHPAFDKPDHALKAIARFEKYLAARPDDLEVRWLLNIAYRAVGGYPEKVPAAWLIAPAALASKEDVGRFVDVANGLGLRSVAIAGGMIVDDFDNDGTLDVVTSSMDSCAPMRFFKRRPGGPYVEQASEAGLDRQLGGLNLLQADYDNDGCLDILLMRGGWDEPQRKSLLRNTCDGRFRDVTVESGLALPVTATQAGAWFDFDNDGFLDLFVGNEGGQAQLFLNKRDGTFVDIAPAAGVGRSAFVKGVTAGDYNNDGWTDLYVSTQSAANVLYRNNRGVNFTDVTAAAGVEGPSRAFATWFFDYDNDGWLDLFVTSYFLSLDETARTYLGLPHKAPTLKLYRNRRDGTFADATRVADLEKVFMPMGSNFGDIDNDGWLDIYLGTGSPSYAAVAPSVLLRNREGQSFVDVTASSGTGELGKGHGVAFADLDADGDDEIVFEVGGATPGDAHALRVFDNPGHGNHWLDVTLVGTKSNRSAIGARITVTAQQPDGSTRAIHRVVGSGGSFGASPLRQHIGLGKATAVVAIETWWPTSNTRQRLTGIGLDAWIEIKELDSTHTTRPRPSRIAPTQP